MFSKEIIEREFQVLAKQFSLNDWELRYNMSSNVAEGVTPLMTEKEAKELKKNLDPVIPLTVSLVASRVPHGLHTHRLMIKLNYIQEGTYVNCFLMNIRLFPHTFWLPHKENFIKTYYPIEYATYYSLLIKALGEFTQGTTLDCFTFSYNKIGELEVVGDVQAINEMIDHHKLRSHFLMEKYFKDIEGITDIVRYANTHSFSIFYQNLIATSGTNGLPGLTLKVQNTETYNKIMQCFPKFINVTPNTAIHPGDDPNKNLKIGVKIMYGQDMCYLITQELHQKIHEVRKEFCHLVWGLKLKSPLSFFPSEIRTIINKHSCTEAAYLSEEEILDALDKIEKNSLPHVNSAVKSSLN